MIGPFLCFIWSFVSICSKTSSVENVPSQRMPSMACMWGFLRLLGMTYFKWFIANFLFEFNPVAVCLVNELESWSQSREQWLYIFKLQNYTVGTRNLRALYKLRSIPLEWNQCNEIFIETTTFGIYRTVFKLLRCHK